MADRQVTEREAFATLSRASQNSNTKLHRLATGIVDTGDGSDLPT
jgi:AmiR/NasT family two-component response regulator